jgi:GT2 family glycosyltransferase
VEVISPKWIEAMIEFAQRKDVGVVGAKLFYPNNTIQHAGVILGIGGVAGHLHKYFPRDSFGVGDGMRLITVQNFSAVTGACMMMRREVFEDAGGFDEGFPHAFNDVELCMKIRQRGYLIVWTPYSELYHNESKSRGREDTPEKQARFRREIELFRQKWGHLLEKGDPYYNPNLILDREDFSIRI